MLACLSWGVIKIMGFEPQGPITRPKVHTTLLGGGVGGEEHPSPQAMLPYTYCIFGLDTQSTITLDEFCELCLELG